MTPLKLRTRHEFEANPKACTQKPAQGDPLGPVGAFLGAYCAGMRNRATPNIIHDALSAWVNRLVVKEIQNRRTADSNNGD